MSRALDVLLRAREISERHALAAAAAAQRELDAATAAHTGARARLAAAGELTADGLGGLLTHRLTGLAALDTVEVAASQRAVAARDHERRSDERVARSIARRSLERLLERRAERELDAQRARERRELDELGLRGAASGATDVREGG